MLVSQIELLLAKIDNAIKSIYDNIEPKNQSMIDLWESIRPITV